MSLRFCTIAFPPIALSLLSFGDASIDRAQTSARDVDSLLELSLGLASYQTRWFGLLVGTLFIIVLWAAYRLRLRVLTDRSRNMLAERLSDRERITRELYDSLLQGMQGLILLFQGVAVQIPPETPLASRLESAIGRAERLMVEARDRVRDLHAPELDLADALRGLNAEQRLLGTEYSVEVIGRVRELQLLVSDEIFKIAREAIVNACQHSSAHHVWVTLSYGLLSLELVVADDGRGVGQDLAENGTNGRWGVSGMKARARKLESSLLISSRTPTGTAVLLTVPASVAYRPYNLRIVERLQRVRDFLSRRGSRR
jgi:signal transduction histidine kinase